MNDALPCLTDDVIKARATEEAFQGLKTTRMVLSKIALHPEDLEKYTVFRLRQFHTILAKLAYVKPLTAAELRTVGDVKTFRTLLLTRCREGLWEYRLHP